MELLKTSLPAPRGYYTVDKEAVPMELGQDKQQTITRLAICVVIAVVLYAALDKLGGGIPKLAPYKPWLEQNKVQAIAIAAAVLFGASLAVFPLEEPAAPPPAASEADPCAGFERACDLP